MSYDGSSCKSYIKHPTEKSRLDNLAFTSFPEDYLPYTCSAHRGAPPYLVWGDGEGRAPHRKRRRLKRLPCTPASALGSAIALILAAILAIVAVSVYLGVVTNLFRSPIFSISGRFRVMEGDEFSEPLLNTTSFEFLTKAESYKALVEDLFLSSSLEPAFVAARVYSFRPGSVVVFFRVHLDRRKLELDDSEIVLIAKNLILEQAIAPRKTFEHLILDLPSIDVREYGDEEWLNSAYFSLNPEATHSLKQDSRVKNLTTPENVGHSTIKQETLSKTPRTSKTDLSTGSTTAWRQSSKTQSSLRTTNTPQRVDATYRRHNPSSVTTGTPGISHSGGHLQPEDEVQFRYGQWRPIALPGAIQVSQPDQPPPKPKEVRGSLGKGTVQLLPDEKPHFEEPFQIRSQVGSMSEGTKPQQPNVASSIMSSVSLFILPSSKNRSADVGESVGIGVVRAVMDDIDVNVPQRGTDIRRESRLEKIPPSFSAASDRKDHASFRFIEEEIEHNVDVGDDNAKLVKSLKEYDSGIDNSNPLPEGHITFVASERPETAQSDIFIRVVSSDDKNRLTNTPEPNLATTEHIQIIETITGSFSKDPRNYFLTTPKTSSVDDETSTEASKILSFSNTFENTATNANKSLQTDKRDRLVVDRQELFTLKSTTEKVSELFSVQRESSTPYFDGLSMTSGMEDGSEMATPSSIPTTIQQYEKFSDVLSSTTLEAVSFLKNGEYADLEESVVTSIDTLLNNFKAPFNDGESSGFDGFDDFSGFSTTEMGSTNVSTSLFGAYLSSTQQPTIFKDENTSIKPAHSTIVNHSQYPTVETKYQTLQTDNPNPPIIEYPSSVNVTNEGLDDNHTLTNSDSFPSNGNASVVLETTEQPEVWTNKDSHLSVVHATLATEAEISSSPELESNSSTTLLQNLLGFPKIVPPFADTNYNPNDINSDNKNDFNDEENDFLDRDKFPPTVAMPDLTSSNFGDHNDENLNSREEKENDVIRHLTIPMPTTEKAQNNSYIIGLGKNPVFSTHRCQEEEFPCDSGECVPADYRCNMRRDCRDNTDEQHCPCSEYLTVVGQSQKICDGVKDCWDLSDEQNCPWCSPGQFICPQSRACVEESQVCDGHNDCPYGADERYCVKLAADVKSAESSDYKADGYVMVRKGGRWGKLCLDGLGGDVNRTAQGTTATAFVVMRWKIEELGRAVCSALTYREMKEAVQMEDDSSTNHSYFQISSEPGSQQKHRSNGIFRPSSCQTKGVVHVKCDSLECGLRPMSTSSRRRIVGGQSTGSGSWPWQVALYKEGDFQCGAVLVNSQWLVSAGHCFYSTQTAYWTARMGLLRRGTELPSPSEQVRRIANIVLHPDYVDKGFINDIALLRLDRPLPFSDYLRPLCLPEPEEDGKAWHGELCSVVGWGKLFEIGHTFPDSLQEVRLPVISTEECRKRIVFLSMYHITDNMFCAGYERGGRDACLGDSGGPLMCQRQDGRWVLLGVTSNGDGCGRPGRPGVYTKVANYLQWIHSVVDDDVPQNSTETTTASCTGHRCPLGRCVAPHKVCDGRFDCADGSDEAQCTAL